MNKGDVLVTKHNLWWQKRFMGKYGDSRISLKYQGLCVFIKEGSEVVIGSLPNTSSGLIIKVPNSNYDKGTMLHIIESDLKYFTTKQEIRNKKIKEILE